jgi:hypothetical protein
MKMKAELNSSAGRNLQQAHCRERQRIAVVAMGWRVTGSCMTGIRHYIYSPFTP